MRLFRAFFLLVFSASIVACHGTRDGQSHDPEAATTQAKSANSAGGSAPIADPCSLVTVDEVSEAMGHRSKPGELRHAFNGNRCNFYDPTSQYEIFLQTVDWNLAGPMMTSANAISGIGDKAFWSYGSIYVLKGGHGMMIGFQLPHVLPSMTPQAEKLGKIVASRM